MIAALPTTPDSGKPPASDFAMVMMSGSTPEFSMPNILPVRAKPVCTSSAMSRIPCWSQILRSAFEKFGRRGMETALALHRLDDDRGDVDRVDVGAEEIVDGASANPRR